MQHNYSIAVFGGGCFWCIEAVFQDLNGVQSVVSGYAGGTVPDPSYRQVCEGATGHAEVIKIEFDPAVITFKTLLEVFFASHDPTTLNRQGADVGDQYRSIILYTDEEQKKVAQTALDREQASGRYLNPIVTQLVPLTQFYPAEDYHQNYYKSNPAQPYCSFTIAPKIYKLKKQFAHLLKPKV